MMVGICRTAKSGWLSGLNHIQVCEDDSLSELAMNITQVFPMHATDDRYAKFFLFTEEEVQILCNDGRLHGYSHVRDQG